MKFQLILALALLIGLAGAVDIRPDQLNRSQNLTMTGGYLLNASTETTLLVESFGAVGDGVTDDTTAIQNALTAAESGDTVTFSKASYNITADLVPVSGTRIDGNGAEILAYKCRGILLDNKNNVTISDIDFVGDGSELDSGIKLNNSENITISGVGVRDFGNDGIQVTYGAEYIDISNSEIFGNGDASGADGHGISMYPNNATTIDEISVSNSRLEGNKGNGFMCDGHLITSTVYHISITDNILKDNGGIGAYLMGKYDTYTKTLKYVTISGNTASGNLDGIDVLGAKYVTMTNNMAVSSSATSGDGDGLVIYQCTGVDICNNIAASNRARGIYIYATSGTQSYYVNVLGNIVESNNQANITDVSGIDLEYTYEGMVAGNVVTGTLHKYNIAAANCAYILYGQNYDKNAKNGGYYGLGSTDPGLMLPDGRTAPTNVTGFAQIYVDTSDGDLKAIFADGTVKTIVADT